MAKFSVTGQATIYKAVNKINGKVYVGKTTGALERRKRQHKHAAKSEKNKSYFHKALLKYGWENFSWEVIDTATDCDELNIKEIFWIKQLEANTSAKGYNLTIGGDGKVGYTHTEEARKRMSEARKGKKMSEDLKKKLIEINTGREHTEEAKKKISDAQIGKPRKTKGERNGFSKLTEKDVIGIKKLLAKGKYQKEIASMYNVARSTITAINKGDTWSHIKIEREV
ncbi:putative endonuclease [Bacillus phage BCP78]|uniref:Putative endonuclease n=3 Tax=Tsarbombavirus BCP78 TaxID=1985182 RepID=J9PR30_9CAUD|nr:homing endonuclease [Bacillus phage BCP78]YP_009783564.1 putative endonuclease [Bacillus phage BCU4]AEW47209.1 putative endonuclease [Bacillus phage BCP78]AEW47697.1 putative endonuclease [Bacillus phage BCU4]AQN32577.1 putative endonuclease [Bacillus phage BCP12]